MYFGTNYFSDYSFKTYYFGAVSFFVPGTGKKAGVFIGAAKVKLFADGEKMPRVIGIFP